ncbi:MAG: phosphate:Na+ symporter, partial [Myxococcales bacterium]|nr:phosphate:Na+ symporter [Myxococcales bacterium]
MIDTPSLRPRARWSMLWAATLLLGAGYFLLPGATDHLLPDGPGTAADSAGEPRRLEITQTAPREGTLGGSLVVTFIGAVDESAVRLFSGKDEITVVSRRPGRLVVHLPTEVPSGYLKLRVAAGDERSKAYHLRVSPRDWRRPFGNLLGGLALLVFGIGIFARGARESIGLGGAQTLTALAARPPVALGLGVAVGAAVQSTTAAAGLLAGLVGSNLLAVVPAASVFLGAQVGAAAMPLLVTIDLHAGLVVVAIGVMWTLLGPDRRSAALGRVLLGIGLVAFGMQALRWGVGPFFAEPALLPFVERLRADSAVGVAACAALGALLVVAFQGPGPALALVLSLGLVTDHVDARVALAVLAGSGLGAGIGGLLATQAAPRSRQLARLHLLLGVASTAIAAASIGPWSHLGLALSGAGAAGAAAMTAARLSPRALGLAFAASQLAGALLLLPLVPLGARLMLRRLSPGDRTRAASNTPPASAIDPSAAVRAGLIRMLRAQQTSLEPLSQLAITGLRAAGGMAEHALSNGRAAVESVIAGPLRMLPATPAGVRFGRAAFACLQLERALEAVLLQAERLTDRRVTAQGGAAVPPLLSTDEQTIREIQALFADGLQALAACLDQRASIDLEEARGREIAMNRCDASARNALLSTDEEPSLIASHLGLIELVDAYEIAGNQAYRLA